MVNWKTGVVVLVLLVALAVYAYASRSQTVPQDALGKVLPCSEFNTVWIHIEGKGKLVTVQRPAVGDTWLVSEPVSGLADQVFVRFLAQSLHSVHALNTLQSPGPASDYGLDNPQWTVSCRVSDGTSYTLTIGKGSFDGSGYYAQRSGQSRVYVISGVEVDEFDRELEQPPLVASPTPAASPRPT